MEKTTWAWLGFELCADLVRFSLSSASASWLGSSRDVIVLYCCPFSAGMLKHLEVASAGCQSRARSSHGQIRRRAWTSTGAFVQRSAP